jgi:hypothetical protein
VWESGRSGGHGGKKRKFELIKGKRETDILLVRKRIKRGQNNDAGEGVGAGLSCGWGRNLGGCECGLRGCGCGRKSAWVVE